MISHFVHSSLPDAGMQYGFAAASARGLAAVQVLRLAEALFNAQQLTAIPQLLTIAGPSVDSPGLRFLQVTSLAD